MSKSEAERFLKDMESDKDLQLAMVPAFDMEKGEWEAEKLKELATEKGYEFDFDELSEASSEIIGEELSDEQLEMIAGGGCSSSSCVSCCCCCSCCCG